MANAGSESFPIPVYGGRVIICITREAHDREHEALDGGKYKQANQVRGVCSFHTEKDNRAVYLLGVFEETQQTLVHELVHLVFGVLSHASVPITRRNDEAFAYLMDTLFKESTDAIKRIRKRRSACRHRP